MQHLIGGHIGEHEAHDLCGVEVLGNHDRTRLGHAHLLGIGAPNREGSDAITDPQA